jgi:trehalose 6-phosphate phosphatase
MHMMQVCQILEANTKDIEGAKIEHNLFCASVHFRWVKEEVTLWTIIIL